MNSYSKIYYEKGKIKRYTKKIKNTSKNAKTKYRTVETVNIGLSKYSKFQDNQNIIILKEDDFNKILTDLENLKAGDNEKENINHAENIAIETDKIKIIQLQEEINRLKDIINNSNELLLGANNSLDKLLDTIISLVANEYLSLFDENLKENQGKLKEFINSVINLYQSIEDDNIRIAKDLEQQVKEFNNDLASKSVWNIWRNKKDINLKLATDELKQPIKKVDDLKLLDVDLATEILEKPNFNKIAIDKIQIKESNNIDFLELYIKTDPKY